MFSLYSACTFVDGPFINLSFNYLIWVSIIAEWEPEKYTFLLLLLLPVQNRGACTLGPSSAISHYTFWTSLSLQDFIVLKSIHGASVLVECVTHPFIFSLEVLSKRKHKGLSKTHQTVCSHTLELLPPGCPELCICCDAYTHSLLEQGLDSMSLHSWVPALNFASDDNGNA